MTTAETTQPAELDSLKAIYARYREIAPPADPESQDVALQLARRLVVDSIRQEARYGAAILAGRRDAEGWAALCAGFAAAHLMTGYLGTAATQAAREIATAIQGGGDIAEWLHEHALTLGIDPAAVSGLAEREAALQAAKHREADQAAGEAAKALKLAQEAVESLGRLADGHERVMYAALHDLSRDDAAAAKLLLSEQLDGFDGEPANYGETGMEYLNRMRDKRKADAEPDPAALTGGDYERHVNSLLAPVKAEVARLRGQAAELAADAAREEAEFLADAASLDTDFEESR